MPEQYELVGDFNDTGNIQITVIIPVMENGSGRRSDRSELIGEPQERPISLVFIN